MIPKLTSSSTPRSIIVHFLHFNIKELVLRKASQQKIEMNGKRIYFNNDYASDIMERHKAYALIKAALKEKGIRFQTPYTKIRVYWDTGLQIYETAEKAAQDLNRRGVNVMVMAKTNTATVTEEHLNAVLPRKRSNAAGDAAQHARERLMEFRRDAE